MKDNKKVLYGLVVLALVLSVIGISIGFAAMSTELTISGQTTVTPASWKIKFTDLAKVSGDDALITTAPQITSDTHIGDYALLLTKPGDKVEYKFKVTNSGSLDAKLSSFTVATPTITGTGATASDDEAIVSANLVYTLTYNDASRTAIAVNDTLDHGESKELILTVEYPATAETLPADEVAVTGMDVTFVYTQK